MVEALADTMSDRSFQRVVVENVFVDEGREFGLTARDVLRFATDTRPNRIDLIECPCGPRLILSHRI
jgi:hypothetical protein